MIRDLFLLCLVLSSGIKAEWLDTFGYNDTYKNISVRTNQPLAIVVLAFNRPDYLKRTIEALEKNPESQTAPFYFFLDGGPSSKQAENIELINNSSLAHKEIIVRPYNYGIPKNHIDTKRFIYDWCNFQKAIILEDDHVVSPTYIRFIQAVHSWTKKNYPQCGIVQGSSYCFLTPQEKKKILNHVQDNALKSWWLFHGYLLDKTVWDHMKETLYYYETQFIDKIPLSEPRARSKPGGWKDVHLIRAWVKQLVETNKNTPVNRSLYQEFSKKNVPVSQDCLMAIALWMARYTKIKTVVNRIVHIGETGMSHTPTSFHTGKQDQIKLDPFEEDNALINFKLVTKKD